MPNNDQGSLLSDIRAGESLMVQEAPTGPNLGAVEDTTPQQQNEENNAQTVQAAEDKSLAVSEQDGNEVSEPVVKAGKKMREIGESRRALAESLLAIAKGNPEKGIPARPDEVKRIIGEDPRLDKYFKKAWPKDYALLFGGVPTETYEENIKEIEQRAKTEAKAELLSEQLKVERREEAYDLALKLSFTQAEAESLLHLAEKLEGEEIAGQKIEWEEALKRSAHTIRPEKAKVGIPSVGSITKAPTETQIKKTQLDEHIEYYAKRWGKDPEQVKTNVKEVEANLKNGVFTLPR